MKMNHIILAIAVIIIIFGTVAGTAAFGIWQTESSKIPARYLSGDFEGDYNPADIRGSYSFKDISRLFEIPLEVLGEAFGIDENSLDTFLCKDLESIYEAIKEEGKEVGTDSVKIFTALYKSLPISLNDTTYFPKPVERILLEKGQLSEEEAVYINNHLVPVESNEIIIKEEEGGGEAENLIKGKTTFKDIIRLGVSIEEIEASLGISITETYIIKDFCTSENLNFSEVKEKLYKLVEGK